MEFVPQFATAGLILERPDEFRRGAIVLSTHAIKPNFWRSLEETSQPGRRPIPSYANNKSLNAVSDSLGL